DLPALDLDRLDRACQRLIERHEMLRSFVTEDGRHCILPGVPAFRAERVDLRHRGAGAVAAAIDAARKELRDHGPSTSAWPLFTVRALMLEDRTRLHVRTSLLVLDGASLRTVLREALRLYEDPDAALPPIGLSYRDYVLALEAHRTSDGYRRSL